MEKRKSSRAWERPSEWLKRAAGDAADLDWGWSVGLMKTKKERNTYELSG